jgi:hypothetical protein
MLRKVRTEITYSSHLGIAAVNIHDYFLFLSKLVNLNLWGIKQFPPNSAVQKQIFLRAAFTMKYISFSSLNLHESHNPTILIHRIPPPTLRL